METIKKIILSVIYSLPIELFTILLTIWAIRDKNTDNMTVLLWAGISIIIPIIIFKNINQED